jgi:hypothetical protein
MPFWNRLCGELAAEFCGFLMDLSIAFVPAEHEQKQLKTQTSRNPIENPWTPLLQVLFLSEYFFLMLDFPSILYPIRDDKTS